MASMVNSGNHISFFTITGENPTIGKAAVAAYTNVLIEKTSSSGNPKQHNVVVTYTQYDNDDALGKFLNDNLSESTATEPTVKTLEDGTEISTGSSGSAPSLYAVLMLGCSGAYRQVLLGPVSISSNSGNIETAGNDFTTRSFEVNFVKATVEITLPDSDIANEATDTFYPVAYVTLPETTPSKMPIPTTDKHAVGVSCIEAWIPKGTKTY